MLHFKTLSEVPHQLEQYSLEQLIEMNNELFTVLKDPLREVYYDLQSFVSWLEIKKPEFDICDVKGYLDPSDLAECFDPHYWFALSDDYCYALTPTVKFLAKRIAENGYGILFTCENKNA